LGAIFLKITLIRTLAVCYHNMQNYGYILILIKQ